MVHLRRLECRPAGRGAPDIAGGALLAQRRAAPTKDLLGRLVSAVGRAKPARGRRPEGLAPPPSGGLPGAHGGHRAQLGWARPPKPTLSRAQPACWPC